MTGYRDLTPPDQCRIWESWRLWGVGLGVVDMVFWKGCKDDWFLCSAQYYVGLAGGKTKHRDGMSIGKVDGG